MTDGHTTDDATPHGTPDPTSHPHRRAFERVRAHLLAQNMRAVGWDGTCVNRSSSELGPVLRCGVGCLIPDATYDTLCESLSVQGLIERGYIDQGLGLDVTGDTVGMLTQLRVIHDQFEPHEWPKVLDRMSANFGSDGRWLGSFHLLEMA